MDISGLLFCGLFLIVLLFISTSISLSALLSPIRKLGRSSLSARVTLILVLGLLSCSISFGTFTRLAAEIQFAFLTMRPSYPDHEYTPAMLAAIEEEQRNKSAIVRELWIRRIIPPSLQGACYTDNSFVCDFVSRYNNVSPTWSAYLQYIGIGFISAVVCGVLVWRFTRPK
jgi:hypothetical protein